MPIFRLPAWMRHYPARQAPQDVLAGLLVTALVIPQSLAYALLAGLPPQVGLYASVFPVLVYALWGSSMTQAVGPVAITSIMTAAVLAPLAQAGSSAYIALASGLALGSGLLVFACGALRLGFLSQLLSRPVVSGFITGSALLVLFSQAKVLVGWSVSHPAINPISALLGSMCLGAALATRRWLGSALVQAGWQSRHADLAVRVMPLAVVLGATVLTAMMNWDHDRAVQVVGNITLDAGMWTTTLPDAAQWRSLVAPVLMLAFVGMVQNISMAQALATRRRERLDANLELMALGSANLVGAFCGGMPVGGGLSRSAINTAAGAQSPLASVVSALAMLGAVLVGTHWFERMPLAALAASIMVAAIAMVDMESLLRAWQHDRADAAAWLGTALGVLLLGLQLGIASGIGLSLATLLWRSSQPHIAVVGRIPGTEHFRNVERHGVQTLPGVLLLRIDESLFFGNMTPVEARLSAEIAAAPQVHDVVLILSAVNRIDTTALEILTDTQITLQARGIRMHLAEVKGPVQDRLAHAPLWAALQGRVHLSANAAFEALAAPACTA